jgi:hypothetical protein
MFAESGGKMDQSRGKNIAVGQEGGVTGAGWLQILLNEARAEVNVELDEGRVADDFKTVDLSGLDDKDVSGAPFEGLAVDGPETAAFADELNFVVRMAMRTRAGAGLAMVQKDGNGDIALLDASEFVGTADERKVFVADMMH